MRALFRRLRKTTLYLIMADAMCFFAAFGLAMRIRFRPNINVIELRTGEMIPELAFVLLLSFTLVPMVFNLLRLYQRRVLLSPPWHAVQILKGVAIVGATYIVLQFLTKSTLLVQSRWVMAMWLGITAAGLLVHRMLVLPFLLRLCARNLLHRRIALMGVNDVSVRFARELLANPDRYLVRPIGFISDSVAVGVEPVPGLPVLGPLSKLEILTDLHQLEGAILMAQGQDYDTLLQTVETCARTFGWVEVHADRIATLSRDLDPDTYFDIPFLRMGNAAQGAWIRWQKRVFDVTLAGLAIVVLAPVFGLIAVLVRLTSPGPIFYVSERVGQGGRKFRFYKFRTMVTGADRDPTRREQVKRLYTDPDQAMPQKVVNPALLTPIGIFLRKWALDELPQLWNVLKGDMSLVGPRPLPPDEYELQTEWQKGRFDVPPGCTGLWKVYAAQYTEMPFSQAAMYDIFYARNANLVMDVTILFKTAWIVLRGLADGPIPPRSSPESRARHRVAPAPSAPPVRAPFAETPSTNATTSS